MISPDDIKRVMLQTGMDYIQAFRHLQCLRDLTRMHFAPKSLK